MARWFHDDRVERTLTSRLDRSKERARQDMLHRVRDNIEEIPGRVAMKLIEDELLETNSKKDIEAQLKSCLETLMESEEFDVGYFVAPYREVAAHPNTVSLYLTAFVIEKLINHRSVVDVFGSDEDIYEAINATIEPFLTRKRKDR